jgi:hypothetical protein
MNSFECPAAGKKCDYCVGLAQVAFANVYQSRHPDMSMSEIATATENSQVNSLIEEQNGIEGQRCETRQTLAKKIGARLGATRR